ncbi:hypothetical protein Tco_0381109 [Tanacetum coccineum]
MAPKRTTRSTPVTPAPTATTITVTEAQLQALIDQGVAAVMAKAEASRVRNGYASNDDTLTWWNAHVKTTTPKAAHAMPWATLKKMMTDKYCLREEIDKIEKYIGGLPDMIRGSVKASKPKTMQEAIEFTTELMDEKTMPMLNIRQKGKESMMIFPRTIKTNNNRTRGRTQARPTLQAIVTGNHTSGLNLYVPSIITIMKVLVHLSAINAKKLAIWQRIVETDLQMLTTTTVTTTIIIRREMVATSEELKDILEETAQN